MATTIDPRRLRERTAGLAPEGAGDGRARAFAVARRHSVLVRAMRFALPMLALIMLGVYGTTTWHLASLRSAGVQLEDIHISSDNLVMANPKYSGNGKDGSRHSVRARAAETDLLTRNRVKLTAIEGDIIQLNGTRIDLTAARGTFEQEAGVLELQEQIDVRSSDGMTAKLTSATVFTKENRIVSNEPVTAQMPSGSLRARAMELMTKQRQATFTGDVAVRMIPQQPQKQQKPAAETATGEGAPKIDSQKRDAPKKDKAAAAALGPSFNSSEPLDVTSDRLLVDDAQHLAMFRSNVVARQGTATLAAPELDAAYAGRSALPGQPSPKPPKAAEGATPAAEAAASRLTSLKARGGIVMTRDSDRATATSLHYDAEIQRTALAGPVDMTSGTDRRASSANAEIDHKADQITLTGAVVLHQGRNVLKGERLAVDRANGRARLDSPADGARGAGRISVLLHRGEIDGARTKASAATGNAGDNRLTGAFRTDPNAPIDIDAATLDFEDARRYAVFSGSVVAKQGDFVIRAPTLTAHFSSQSALLALPTGKGSEPASAASLKKIEARGGVVITGKDGQKVTGEAADFDPASNFATVTGHVVVTQDKNVVEGSKLIMDLTSGRTRFETASPGAVTAEESQGTSAVPCVAGQTCTSRRRIRAVFFPQEAKKLSKSSKRSLPTQRTAPPATTGSAPRSSQSSWESSTKPSETGTPR